MKSAVVKKIYIIITRAKQEAIGFFKGKIEEYGHPKRLLKALYEITDKISKLKYKNVRQNY
jgi:hypothetical protein